MDNVDDPIDRIGGSLTRLRLIVGRRILSKVAMASRGASMDLSSLDVLAAIPGRSEGREVNIGDVARRLRVDHSRASRLTAHLVRQGLVERSVSQEDTRCAVLYRTTEADALIREIQAMKESLILEITRSWSEERRRAFARDFEDFVTGCDEVLSRMTGD